MIGHEITEHLAERVESVSQVVCCFVSGDRMIGSLANGQQFIVRVFYEPDPMVRARNYRDFGLATEKIVMLEEPVLFRQEQLAASNVVPFRRRL